jgi:uncharacterized protein YmfQ (DUF2313 family)
MMALSQLPRDRHVRRSGNDYTQAFLTLLPQGQAWPRESSSTLFGTCDGLSQYWGFVDSRAADLLERESDPRKTIELLPDWERAWGLPDPCFADPQSIAERQTILVKWMTLLGAQSRDWFTEVASWAGYTLHGIGEFAPWMCGISRCGETPDENGLPRWEIAPSEIRFYWKVFIDQARLTWFRCSAGQCGVDPHLMIGLATDLECLLRRWKPAQTELIFDYSGLSTGGSMAGTP